LTSTPYEELRRALFHPSPCPACADEPCTDHTPQPGDDELGRALLRMFGDMVAARCADPGTVLRKVGG